MSTWVKLHRKIINWQWYDDVKIKAVFIHLILTVSHVDTLYRGQEIKKGQRIFGRERLARDIGISVQSLRRALDKLADGGEITIQTTNRGSLLTLCNYNEYNPTRGDEKPVSNQLPNQQTTSCPTSKQPANNQQTTTIKNIKNNKKVKKKEIYSAKDFLKTGQEIDWIDNGLWSEWVDRRRKMKLPITERVCKKNIKTLEGFGIDRANQIIEQTLDKGWKDFYDIKQDSGINNIGQYKTARERAQERSDEVKRAYLEKSQLQRITNFGFLEGETHGDKQNNN